MNRIYFPYWLWEEYHCGMWRNVFGEERKPLLDKAIEFTGNAKLYGQFMMKAIKQWPYSCIHNLSCIAMNRQAWIGHAACCIAIDCPEDITRLAWHQLTKQQQDKANAKADRAISKWENMYKEGIQLCLRLS